MSRGPETSLDAPSDHRPDAASPLDAAYPATARPTTAAPPPQPLAGAPAATAAQNQAIHTCRFRFAKPATANHPMPPGEMSPVPPVAAWPIEGDSAGFCTTANVIAITGVK